MMNDGVAVSAPLILMALWVLTGASALAQTPTYGIGRTPSAEEVRAMDISIGPSGKELPPGEGTAKEGAAIYAQKCAVCHGVDVNGETPSAFRQKLVGGQGTLATPKPVLTIGSFWPFATTVWDFINRAMPQTTPGSLQPGEVFALTAFLLYRNGIIKETDVMDARSLPKVRMPNRNNFVPPRLEDINRLRCRNGTCP